MISRKAIRAFSTQNKAEAQFESMMNYARKDLLLKCGNNEERDSRFYFPQRWYLERKLLNYNH